MAAVADDADATMIAAPQPASDQAVRPAPTKAPSTNFVPAARTKRNQVPLLAGATALVLAVAGGGWFLLAGSTPAPTISVTTTPAPVPVSPLVIVTVPTPASSPAEPLIATPPPTGPAAALPPVTALPPVVEPTPAQPAPPTPPSQPASTPLPPTAPPSPARLRTALQAAVAAVPCTLLTGNVSAAGNVTLEGLASRQSEPLLRDLITKAAERAPVDWRVAAVDDTYCQALDVIRPYAQPFGSPSPDVQLALKAGKLKLRDFDNMVPRFVMPNYEGYAQLSYFSSDRSLAHLYPSALARQLDITPPGGRLQPHKIDEMASRKFPAGATVDIGDPTTRGLKGEDAGWQVGEPFGFDMLMIITAAEPLFRTPRPAEESLDSYLRDLQSALANAASRGVRVNARAVLVEILRP